MKKGSGLFLALLASATFLGQQQISCASSAPGEVPEKDRLRYELLNRKVKNYIHDHPGSPLGFIIQSADFTYRSSPDATSHDVLEARSRIEREYALRGREASGDVPKSFDLRAGSAVAKATAVSVSQTTQLLGSGAGSKIVVKALQAGANKAIDNISDIIHERTSAPIVARARGVQIAERQIPGAAWDGVVDSFIKRAMTDRRAETTLASLADYLGPMGKMSAADLIELDPVLRSTLPDGSANVEQLDANALIDNARVKFLATRKQAEKDKAKAPVSDAILREVEARRSEQRAREREEVYDVVANSAQLARQLAPVVGHGAAAQALAKSGHLLDHGAQMARTLEALRAPNISVAKLLSGGFDMVSIGLNLFSAFGGLGSNPDAAVLGLNPIHC